MASKPSPIPAGILERYKQLVATEPGIELKGATMPYTSINGNMFSFISKEGRLNLRLAKADLTAFLEKHKAPQSVQHGVVMKEYAEVPDTLFKDIAAITPYFHQSCSYARALKAKPTTKPKK